MFRFLLVFALICYMHTWQRVPNPPISWKISLYCLPLPLFFKFCPLLFLVASNLHLHCFFVVTLFLLRNGWVHHIWCIIVLNYIMDPCISSLVTWIPEWHCCVFYVTRHQLYIVWFFAGTLVDIIHTLTLTHVWLTKPIFLQ